MIHLALLHKQMLSLALKIFIRRIPLSHLHKRPFYITLKLSHIKGFKAVLPYNRYILYENVAISPVTINFIFSIGSFSSPALLI